MVIGLIVVVLLGGACLLLFSTSENRVNYSLSSASALTTSTTTPSTVSASSTMLTGTSTNTASTSSVAGAAQNSGTSTAIPMQYETVTTIAAQEQGLGGRSFIPDNYAMLFVFPSDNTYGFWMKDMLVPIDMIWLSDTGTIIKIDPSVSPATYPDVFYPPAPVKYVLETKSGFAVEHGWTIGTQVALPPPY